MTRIYTLLLVLGGILISSNSIASHIQGGIITAECLGGNQYQITLTLYEDCGTAFTGSGNFTITVTNDCGLANPSGSLPNTVFQQEVSQLCPSQIAQSECNGGTLPGVYMHQWSGTMTLPAGCDSWCFSYSSCCWNTSTNVSGQPGYYYETCINTATAPCNSSPEIAAQPIPYVCVNQPVSFSLGGTEPDGHTIQYSFMDPQTSNTGAVVTWNAGYSTTQPIPGMTIDPNTGQINFTPTMTGNYIVGIQIDEYDANGNLVSTTYYYYQFVVINCTNTVPDPPAGGVTNMTGAITQTAPNAIEICENEAFCFDVVFTDNDAGQVLTVTSNVLTQLPGSTINITGTNPVTATVCYTTAANSPANTTISFTVEDDACPTPGISSYDVFVTILNNCCLPGTITGVDETCQGDNDGSATATGDGTGPWDYVWDDGTNTIATNNNVNGPNTITNLAPGTYNVTITDAAGCVDVQTITIAAGPACCPMTNTVASTNASCNGVCDGTITLTEANGAAPVQFSINNGATFQGTGNFTGVCAGTYNILIEDANGCQFTQQVTITEPPVVTINNTVVDATCGNPNGSITLTGGGGSGAGYQYSIDNGATFQGSGTFNGLSAGNYTVVVQDGAGCQVTTTITVGNTGAPSIDNTSFTQVSCSGNCDGIITVTASGGTGALSYSIDNGTTFQGTGNFTGVCDGTYSIVVEDANGCPAFTSVTVTAPNPMTFTATPTDLNCNSLCTGEINFSNVNGGTAPYQYSIDNGVSFQTGTGFTTLCAGTYDVVVQDVNGCTSNGQVVVNQPPALNLANAFTNPTCVGACDGSITLTGSGGTAPLEYSTDNGITYQPSGTFTGLCAGTYDVVVNDANGCKLFGTVTLTDPPALTLGNTTVDATCGQANGEITLTGGGGTPTYQYSIDNGTTYQVSGNFTGLPAGTYDVAVMDINGCVLTDVVPVNNLSAPTIDNVNFTDPLCQGVCDGTLDITASGGVAPLQYSIDGGTTFQPATNFTGLCSGTYNLTVEDANGCQVTGTATLTDPLAMSYSVTITDLQCFQQCQGVIDVNNVIGGTGTYQFSIDGGTTFQASGNFTGLCAGSYNVVVEDGNGCQATSVETVSEPTQVTFVGTPVDASCNAANGACDGEISVVANGGTGTYLYSIDNGASFQGSNIYTGLCAGTYDVVVEDANGCQATGQVIVNEPPLLDFTSTTTTTSCGFSNGTMTLTGNGGTGGYQYSIDNGVTFQASGNFTGLAAGAYNCCVQDVNGCLFCAVVNVNNDPAQVITGTPTIDVTCFNGSDGEITVNTTGGTTPIQYGINGGALSTNNVFTNLPAGTHNIETQDDNGCLAFATVTINEPDSVTFSPVVVDLLCYQQCIGSIDFTNVAGGNGSYQYSIDGGVTFQAGTLFNNLCAGTYDLVVQDGNGCLGATQITITEPTELTMTFSTTDAICNGYCDGTADAVVLGGTPNYTYAWSAGTGGGPTDANVSGLCAGTYDLTVTDNNGCQVDTIGFVINEPAPFVITNVAVTDEFCLGDCTGEIDITAPSAVQFSINNGTSFQGTGLFTGLCAGTYDILVIDAAGCMDSTSATIGSPTALGLIASNDTTICQGGTATLQGFASGGTAPYTYNWDIPATGQTQTVSPQNQTVYTVSVVDANGCISPDRQVVVSILSGITVTTIQDQTICNGDSALLEADAVGGDGGPYTYTWTNQNTGQTMNGTPLTVWPTQTTVYTVSVLDGCETPAGTGQITVTVNQNPQLLWSANPTSGCTPLTVEFINMTDPNFTGSCFWDFGDGNVTNNCDPTHTFVTPGCYDITFSVTSPEGCTTDTILTDYVCVSELPIPDFSFGPQPTSILNTVINFNNNTIDGDTYFWDFGDGSAGSTDVDPVHQFPDSAGTYTVCLTAYTNAGCDSMVCHDVIIDDEFLIYVPNAFTPDGDGINDIFLPTVHGIEPTSYELYIFDRWGQVIFDSYAPQVGWDGSVKSYGSESSKTDVYVWKIVLKDAVSGEKKEFYGHVTLLK